MNADYCYWLGVIVGVISAVIASKIVKWLAHNPYPPKRYFAVFYAAYSTDNKVRVFASARYCLSKGEVMSLDSLHKAIKDGQSVSVDVVQITSIYEFKTKEEYDVFHT